MKEDYLAHQTHVNVTYQVVEPELINPNADQALSG